MEYNFESDIKFLVGDKSLRKSITEIVNIGCRRIMLICDEISDRVGQVSDMLRQFDRELNIVETFRRIGDIATVADCERALRAYKSKECDSIFVAGRKSAVAVAKAVKIMLKDDISFMSQHIRPTYSPYRRAYQPFHGIRSKQLCQDLRYRQQRDF